MLAPACETAPQTRPNVLLIVVDTLRHDHLGCYGAERDTSPAIDALASDAVRFDRTYATASWTKPSVASMLTGLYPSGHGVTTLKSKLSDDALTIAEILAREGFATGAVISHVLLEETHNFHQGFDSYLNAMVGRPFVTASTDRVVSDAQALLRRFAEQRQSFFLLVHFFDPHYDYMHHPQFGFAPPSVGRLSGGEDIERLMDGDMTLTSEELDFLRALYDEEIRFTDDGIGRLLETLKELDLYDQTLVVLTADHGEEFATHGGLAHTQTLYEELIRVPLIVRDPRNPKARVIEEPVSLVALTPTILDLVGVNVQSPPFHAPSFAPLLSSASDREVDEIIYCEADFEVHKKAIVVGRLKIIRDETTGKTELYDLSTDPDELEDRAERYPDEVAALLPILERHAARAREDALGAGETALSEEEIEKLRALGYVGSKSQ